MSLRSGMPTQLPPPVEGYESRLPASAKALLDDVLACSAIGSPNTVRSALSAFIKRTRPDELIITSQMFDHTARLHSFEIAAALQKEA